ncbi:MAG: helix-turn-helix transcriptional regulator, partial [Sphaerochaetaceae bacterium]
MESQENRILFKEDFSIRVNDDRNPLFYVFDYGVRSDVMNMEFQHFHDFYELFFLVDDHASHIIEGEYFSLQRYDLVLLKPSLLHMTMYPKGERPKARLIIAFRFPLQLTLMERQVKRLLRIFDEKPPIFRFSGSVLNRILYLFNSIYLLGTELQPGYDLMIHGKFLELLWIIQTNQKANLFTKAEITDSITHKIYEVTSYLHTHYPEELSLQEVADHFSVSSFYLSHQFKRVTGMNFVSYLQQIRVRNAQQLLLYSTMKIKEICTACGFTSFS